MEFNEGPLPVAAVDEQQQWEAVMQTQITRRSMLRKMGEGLVHASQFAVVAEVANVLTTPTAHAATRGKVCHPSHKVQPNETLGGIIDEEGYTENSDQLAARNSIPDKNLIHPGKVVEGTCPSGATVVTGDGQPNQASQSASGQGDVGSWLVVLGVGIGVPVAISVWWNNRKKAAAK